MTLPWQQTLPKADASRTAITATIPAIETARLRLRAPRIEDWPALEPIWTTERAIHIGGPFTAKDAFLDFCQAAAGWVLRGLSAYVIEDRNSGEIFGMAGLFVDWGDPEAELGWLLTEAAEGRGIAHEAALAILDHLLGDLGMSEVVSYINHDNARSIALAEKLGAVRDSEPLVVTESGPVLVFRHSARASDRTDAMPTQYRRNTASKNGGQI